MIANSLILPSEQPPSLRDIKHALLSFDSIYLTSPDDRELIPPNGYITISTGMPPLFSMPVNAVRPLGKIRGYDEAFNQVLDAAMPAQTQGCIKIRSAPVYNQQFTLGAVLMPEDIPNPRLTYWGFRALAANSNMIAAVSRGLDEISSLPLDDADLVAPTGAEDGTTEFHVNGQPALSPYPLKAEYPGFVAVEDERPVMTRLCHARLGSLAKCLVLCEKEALVPYTSDIGLASVIQALDGNSNEAIDGLIEDDLEREILKRLAWLHRVVVQEFIDPSTFDQLTVAEILKLRTRAWGKASEARHALNQRLKEFALEKTSFEEFRLASKTAFDDYKAANADLNHERSQLRIKSGSEILIGLGSSTVVAGAADMIFKFLSTGSLEIALVFGALYLFGKVTKEQIVPYRDYLKKKTDLKESSSYALLRPYDPFIR